MTRTTPQDFIGSHVELISLPNIVIRLNQMLDDPDCSAETIGMTIGEDPGLTARLLKIVNSPFYGFPSQVDTISMAITILGTRQLRDLVLATSLINRFQSLPSQIMDMDTFWCHSITCAIAARCFATRLKVQNAERFFVAGLLHDIGLLVMALVAPQQARKLLQLTASAAASAERDLFGFDHAELGAELLRHWQLPESLIEPTAFHHQPGRAKQFPQETAVVHLANVIANNLQPSVVFCDDTVEDHQAWQILGLSAELLETLHEEVYAQLDETLDLLYFEQAA